MDLELKKNKGLKKFKKKIRIINCEYKTEKDDKPGKEF